MAGLYDKILHGNFSGSLGRVLFPLGLKARGRFFAFREFSGRLLHPHGKRRLPSDIKKILIIRTDRIGDIVLSTPALAALRRRFPEAEIDYVVPGKYASLLNCYQGWNAIYKADVENPEQLKKLGRELRERRYDVAFVQHPSAYAYRLAQDSRAAYTVGWRAKGYGYLLDRGFVDDRAEALRHQVENNLLLMSVLGVADPAPAFSVKETPAGIEQFGVMCSRNGIGPSERILAIHPGSYSPRVRWLPERFGGLIDKAHEQGLRPVLFGSEGDREVIDRVLASAKKKPVVSIGELGLEGLVSFLKNASAFVGNSTGPMHIAASTGTWTIAIFGSRYPMDSMELWRPWGPKGIVVAADRCTCYQCIPWTCRDMECLTRISVDMVWKALEQVLAPGAGSTPA